MDNDIRQKNFVPRIDMGLLAVLVAVVDAGSVVRAAEQMNLSQPSVSYALKRLRSLTRDPLIKRERGNMVLTPRAEALVEEARHLVLTATRLLTDSDFNPATSTYTYRCASSQYGLLTCLHEIRQRLLQASPAARMSVSWADDRVYDDLLSRKLDFAFIGDIASESFGRDLIAREVFRDEYIGVMCCNHPLARVVKSDTISIKQWVYYDHVQFSNRLPSRSSVDHILLQHDLSRRVTFSSPDHLMNLSVLPRTNLLYALPSRLRSLLNDFSLVEFDLPIKIPAYPFYFAYHKMAQNDPHLSFALNLIHDLYEI